MTDERQGPPADDGEEKGPAPSTWAGRARSEPGEGAGGVTDEIDAVHQALDDELEDGLEDFGPNEQEAGSGQMAQTAEGGPQTADEQTASSEEQAAKAPPAAEPEPVKAPEPARGDTVEADTLALAEQEAAAEAALQGIRARTATHATKLPTPTPPPASATPPAAPTPPPVAAAPSPPAPPARPRPATDVGEPPKRGVWMRFLVGAILIVIASATSTAVTGLVAAKNFLDDLSGLHGVQNQLDPADPGKPQTILILGSDKRPGEGDRGRSDTTILLRVSSSQINLLSIPRDLKVFIPGHGVDKFNAAYTYGGPQLTVKTVKQLTGLTPNVVVNIDFTGFAKAVDEIGCVYIDVDHHYYHSNDGLAPEEQYAAIDIPAGYQRMCGFNALSYVRYRHEDNDLVRSARQQAFLREARSQVPAEKFVGDFGDLRAIVTKYTTTSIQSLDELFGLARLFLSARSAQLHEIHFPANAGGPEDIYLTTSSQAIREVVAEFLGTTTSPSSSSSSSSSKSTTAAKSGGQPSTSKPQPAKKPPESNLVGGQQSDALADVSSSGPAAAAYATKTAKGDPIGIPVYYPTKLPPGAEFDTQDLNGDPDNTRGMTIDGGGGHAYYGYKIVAEIPAGTAGYAYTDYFGFSGTNWRDAPILDNPTVTKTVNGHDFMFYYDNGRLRQIGWKTDDAAYWVENDLLETLTQDQMLGMAESMTKYVG